MKKKITSYGFIDANNLILGVRSLGINIDYAKFFRFLKDKYRLEKAFWIVGYRKEFESMYAQLRSAGFTIVFKKVTKNLDKKIPVKGNVDILLAVQSFRSLEQFDRCVLVSGDGDFLDLIHFLKEKEKEVKICIPNGNSFPKLFNSLKKDCVFLSSPRVRKQIEYKKKH